MTIYRGSFWEILRNTLARTDVLWSWTYSDLLILLFIMTLAKINVVKNSSVDCTLGHSIWVTYTLSKAAYTRVLIISWLQLLLLKWRKIISGTVWEDKSISNNLLVVPGGRNIPSMTQWFCLQLSSVYSQN